MPQWNVGERIPAQELTDHLDAVGVRSQFSDDSVPESVRRNLDELGWTAERANFP